VVAECNQQLNNAIRVRVQSNENNFGTNGKGTDVLKWLGIRIIKRVKRHRTQEEDPVRHWSEALSVQSPLTSGSHECQCSNRKPVKEIVCVRGPADEEGTDYPSRHQHSTVTSRVLGSLVLASSTVCTSTGAIPS
jgi:hypothetical protein